nr:hypothetical protein [Otarine picobirnavirus]
MQICVKGGLFMTQNQIAYWRLQEDKRSHKSDETERRRTNLANEAIKQESNQLRGSELNELIRSNTARESENWRHNVTSEGETQRHNRADEGQKGLDYLLNVDKAQISGAHDIGDLLVKALRAIA